MVSLYHMEILSRDTVSVAFHFSSVVRLAVLGIEDISVVSVLASNTSVKANYYELQKCKIKTRNQVGLNP